MASSDQVRVVLHKECEDKHTDVHSVVIGIGCDDDLVVAEIVDVLLKAECVDQKVQLLVPNNRDFVPYTLAEVIITGSTVIGEYAFSGCESIVSITLPASLTKVEKYAFEECTSLKDVNFVALDKWCRIVFENYSANPLAYANGLYIDGTLITELTVPAGITAILPYSFYGAASLTKINLAGVTTVGKDAFSRCTELNTVIIPASVQSIGARAFVGCESLEKVYIDSIGAWASVSFGDALANPLYYAASLYVNGESVTAISVNGNVNSYAFVNCDFLTAVTFEGTVYVGSYAFYNCNKITALVLPATAFKIGNSAFEGCSAIATADFGGVSEFGVRAFADCTALTTVALNSATVISKEAFSGCVNVTAATLGEGVTTIGVSAFYGCEKLASVNVPASVTVIGAHAFAECDALLSATFGQATGWTVKGNAVEDLADTQKAAAKLKALANNEWTRA